MNCKCAKDVYAKNKSESLQKNEIIIKWLAIAYWIL